MTTPEELHQEAIDTEREAQRQEDIIKTADQRIQAAKERIRAAEAEIDAAQRDKGEVEGHSVFDVLASILP